MNIESHLQHAKWVTAPKELAAPIIVRSFSLRMPQRGEIALSALGFFVLFVNGKRVGNEYFLPSNSLFCRRDFEDLLYPISDEFTYRCYYSVYDITPYLREGENTIEIHLGDGWYRQKERIAEGTMKFGDALGTIYAMRLTDDTGEHTILSDGTERSRKSPIVYSQLFYGEIYDATAESGELGVDILSLPETKLSPEDSAPDRVIRKITPKLLFSDGNRKLYDAMENISGFATLLVYAARGEKVVVRFAENLKEGQLDFASTGSDYQNPEGKPQIMEDVFIGDGERHEFQPMFVWHAFRYFEVRGAGEAVSVSVVHSDVPKTAAFHSSSAELNWLFDAFLRTQLNNMHGGVPSDCPHRERLGYTGDGQVCAEAAMTLLDGRAFYRKWIRDIFDSQDQVGGHINHTAPFAGGGGGPGGWCLGDWCTLEPTAIPESYVNTCYFIKSLQLMEEFALLLGQNQDRNSFSQLREKAEKSVTEQFYNDATSSFAEGIQGADAFAIFAEIGGEKTLAALVQRYRKLLHFDTGFLATALLCRILFQNHEEDLAYELLITHELGSFPYMMDRDATTLWEDWKGTMSHDHPMFGACAVCCIKDLLGIRQTTSSVAYQELVIAPRVPKKLKSAEGFFMAD